MKSQITMLKVKIKSLAVEARIIRLEERKAKGRRLAKKRRKIADSGEYVRDPKYLEFRGRDDQKYKALRDHRFQVVAVEARLSLLAYGYLRGVPYAAMEKRPKDKYGYVSRPGKAWIEPDWKRVLEMVIRFGSAPGIPNKTTAEELTTWHQAVAVPAV